MGVLSDRRVFSGGAGMSLITSLSVGGLFLALGLLPQSGGLGEAPLRALLSVLGVLLSWALLHTSYAMHYAHLYYRVPDKPGGMDFPGEEDPAVGTYTSLALEPTAPYTPHVSYDDMTSGLKHAWRTPAGWLSETVDTAGGKCSSLVLDLAPPYPPRVSYFDGVHGSLKYAWLSGTTWLSATVDNSGGNVGLYTSLALDAAGRPRIGYFDETSGDLRFAWLGGRDRTWLPLVVRKSG